MSAHQDAQDQLHERLRFLGIDADAKALLRQLQPLISAHIGDALGVFYAMVRNTPETAAFFKSEEHIGSARNLQAKHWELLTSGKLDESYVEGVTRIGMTHARIGLEPRWYIAGYSLVLEQLIHSMMAEHWPSRFGRSKSKALASEISIIVKAALLDMDYAISVYLQSLEDERKRADAQRARVETEQESALGELERILNMLSTGDLEARLPASLPGRYAGMVGNYNDAVETLRASIVTVRVAADEILTASQAIAGATNELSLRTVQQAAGVEESSAALHELTESVTTTAGGAIKAAELVKETLTVAESSGTVVAQAVSAMSEIAKSSDEIAKILGVIDEIAFQTNLLALNAGVEAARAGDAGRGFAVVAQEVRALAQRCSAAAQEIKTIIVRSSGQVQNGVELVNRSGTALDHIIGKVGDLNHIVGGIATAAGEQSIGLNEVSSAVANMDSITQNNAGMVEKTSDEINVLTAHVEHLVAALRGFKSNEPGMANRQDRGWSRHEEPGSRLSPRSAAAR
jgi:methyl-accepting chemotaxis protein